MIADYFAIEKCKSKMGAMVSVVLALFNYSSGGLPCRPVSHETAHVLTAIASIAYCFLKCHFRLLVLIIVSIFILIYQAERNNTPTNQSFNEGYLGTTRYNSMTKLIINVARVSYV